MDEHNMGADAIFARYSLLSICILVLSAQEGIVNGYRLSYKPSMPNQQPTQHRKTGGTCAPHPPSFSSSPSYFLLPTLSFLPLLDSCQKFVGSGEGVVEGKRRGREVSELSANFGTANCATVLTFYSITNKICKCMNIIVAFTQKYSGVSYPLRNVSILSKALIHPRTPHYQRGKGQRGFLRPRIKGKIELSSCLTYFGLPASPE